MQMLKHWNVPQTRADGRDRPLLFTLKEHDITTYGPSDWSVVREWWLAEWGEWGEDMHRAEAKCKWTVFHGKKSNRRKDECVCGQVFLNWLSLCPAKKERPILFIYTVYVYVYILQFNLDSYLLRLYVSRSYMHLCSSFSLDMDNTVQEQIDNGQ